MQPRHSLSLAGQEVTEWNQNGKERNKKTVQDIDKIDSKQEASHMAAYKEYRKIQTYIPAIHTGMKQRQVGHEKGRDEMMHQTE